MTDEEDEGPRDASDIFGRIRKKFSVEAWREWWNRPGRLEAGMDASGQRWMWGYRPDGMGGFVRYRIDLPSECGIDGCRRLFTDNAVGRAALENHIKLDH